MKLKIYWNIKYKICLLNKQDRVASAKESSKEYEELANEYKRDLENI